MHWYSVHGSMPRACTTETMGRGFSMTPRHPDRRPWRHGLEEKPRGLQVLPRRWVVGRTFAWLGQARGPAKDYERSPETAGAMIYWAIMSRIMLRAPRRSVPSRCSEQDWECGFKALCKTVSRGRVEPREYSPNAIPGLCGGPGLGCYGFPGPPWLLRERVAEVDTPEAIEKRRRGTAATPGPGLKDWRHLAVQVMLRCAAAQALPVGNSNASSDSGYISIE